MRVSMDENGGLIPRIVTGVGGAALVASVFLPWYSLSLADVLRSVASQLPAQVSGSLPAALAGAPTLTATGWNAVHVIRLVVVLVGLAALLSSVAYPGVSGERGGPLAAGGLLAAVLVAYRIESPPMSLDISFGPFHFPTPEGSGGALSSLLHVELGAWVALGGCVLVVIGGLLALSNGRAGVAELGHSQPASAASKATTQSWTW